LRYEDKHESNTELWHQQHQTKEKSMTVSNFQMSHISHYLLNNTDPRPLIKKRMENYSFLATSFSNMMLFPHNPINF
ncbi:hypothetical protein ABTL15_21670, partial [Acinetobacter baumannii]